MKRKLVSFVLYHHTNQFSSHSSFCLDGVLPIIVGPVSIDSHSIEWSIGVPADFSQTFSHMIVSVKEGDTYSNKPWVHVETLSSDIRDSRVSGLKANTRYTVQIDGILRGELGRAPLGHLTMKTHDEESESIKLYVSFHPFSPKHDNQKAINNRKRKNHQRRYEILLIQELVDVVGSTTSRRAISSIATTETSTATMLTEFSSSAEQTHWTVEEGRLNLFW